LHGVIALEIHRASDETASIVGNIAIARFTFAGESESDGRIRAVTLGRL
jgi:hypothetical protein